MAFASLNTGATNFAAANWSDTIGFANSAELRLNYGSQTIISGLDQSSLGTGVSKFNITKNWTGNIGSATVGPARFDCDVSPGTIQYSAAGGSFYFRANGGNNLATKFVSDGAGTTFFQGGTITNLEVASGTFYCNDQAVPTNIYQYGGRVVIDAGGTAVTNIEVHGGVLELYRNFTGTIKISGPTARVVFESTTGTPGTVTIDGGATLDHRSGNIATLTGNNGRLILTNAINDLTIGSTAFTVGANFRYDRGSPAATITFSNVIYRGGVGGPTGYGGDGVL